MKDNTVSKLCLLRAAINYFSYQDNVAASNTFFSPETFQHFSTRYWPVWFFICWCVWILEIFPNIWSSRGWSAGMFTLDICVGWITLSYQELKGDLAHHSTHNHDSLLWSRCKPCPELRAFEANFNWNWVGQTNWIKLHQMQTLIFIICLAELQTIHPRLHKLFNRDFELLISQNIGCFYITGPSILPPFLKYFNPWVLCNRNWSPSIIWILSSIHKTLKVS